MKKKLVDKEKVLTFEEAIRLALRTPRLTRKQIDALKKQGKLKALQERK